MRRHKMNKIITSLNGTWKFRKQGETNWSEGTVPGDVHTDLYNEGKILDPYYADNFKELKWISKEGWEYVRNFNISEEILKLENQTIEFDSIDTFSDIYLNDNLIMSTDNMFIQQKCDVKKYLRNGNNELKVVLKSIFNEMEQYPYKKYYACFNIPRVFTRKVQCHFGWDWAPEMPGYGICQSVRLVSSGAFTIEDIYYRTKINGEITFYPKLSYNVKVNGSEIFSKSDSIRVRISTKPDCLIDDEACIEKIIPVSGKKHFVNLNISDPQLWFPHDLGAPHLYSWEVCLIRNGEVLDSKTGKLGIREIKLLENPIDTQSMGFMFEINKIPVYCKGSNWVPAECFTGSISNQRYERLIELAKDANFNILRVWGGGMYEKDIFYKLCDEKGIMVWQDIMFACSDIPDDNEDFKKRVIRECEYQVRRLRNHPSIVYWCGGNEKTGTFGLMMKYGEELVDYTIRGICNHLDPTRPYVRQSPFSLADVGNDYHSGDSHANCMDPALESGPENYRSVLSKIHTSFNSESAILGPCRLKSLKKFIPENQLWPTTELWEERFLKNPYANSPITFLEREKIYAKALFGDYDSLEELIKKAMAAHGEVLKSEAFFHRSRRGKSGGFLNWMFNDIWPTGTWSVVDYYLEPKPAYYMQKKAFTPTMPAFVLHQDSFIKLYVINDKNESYNCSLEYGIMRLDGKKTKVYKIEGKEIGALKSEFIASVDFDLPEDGKSYLYVIMKTELGEIHNQYFYQIWKNMNWDVPEIVNDVISSEISTDGKYVLNLSIETKNTFARMVNLNVSGDDYVFYSDNYFDIFVGEKKLITIKSENKIHPEQIEIKSWVDVWDS